MITPRSVKNVKTKFTLLHKITYVSLRFGQSAMFASDRKVQCTKYIQAGSGIKLSFFLPVIWYVVLVPFFLPVLSCYNLFFTQLKQFECRTKQENCNVTITIILVKFAYTFIYLFFFFPFLCITTLGFSVALPGCFGMFPVPESYERKRGFRIEWRKLKDSIKTNSIEKFKDCAEAVRPE